MTITSSPEPLVTHNPQVSLLWEKLCRFSFDRSTGPRTFAKRLANEQGWPEPFTALTIEEYRRFLLLFALDRRERADIPGATGSVRIVPSVVVDKVWHLHLLYTQSYWEDLCRDILEGPLHHVPSDGSSGEASNLDTVYMDTLAAYRRTFGQAAPASIWPSAETSEIPVSSAMGTGARSTQAFAGLAVLVGAGLFVTAMLALGHFLPTGLFVFAVIAVIVVLVTANRRRPARGRDRSGIGVDAGGGNISGDSSGGAGSETHHGSGHHGGDSHDAGGHSHSCGGGHSCGGHGCGGHGCGGGCGGH